MAWRKWAEATRQSQRQKQQLYSRMELCVDLEMMVGKLQKSLFSAKENPVQLKTLTLANPQLLCSLFKSIQIIPSGEQKNKTTHEIIEF